MAKKTSFRSAISPFGPNLVPKILFLDFSSIRCQTLLQAIITSISKKTNKPNMRKRKKTSFRLILACFGRYLVINFLVRFTSTRCYALLQAITVCNFKENQCTKLVKITKTLVLGPIFASMSQTWAQKLRKTNDPNFRKW